MTASSIVPLPEAVTERLTLTGHEIVSTTELGRPMPVVVVLVVEGVLVDVVVVEGGCLCRFGRSECCVVVVTGRSVVVVVLTEPVLDWGSVKTVVGGTRCARDGGFDAGVQCARTRSNSRAIAPRSVNP